MNIELLLTVLTLLTGILAVFDRLVLQPRRKKAQLNSTEPDHPPLVFDYARSLFPVFLIVLLIRSFFYEPFRIPSGSLEPTLLVGDFILVNKFIYGIRLPVSHAQIIPVQKPQRGDIMVFRFPPDPRIDYIKRVVGLPGDKISYVDKQFTINGQAVPQTLVGYATQTDQRSNTVPVLVKEEDLMGVKHLINVRPGAFAPDMRDIIVPAGHYFMVGDNRDDSADSRVWGFVPEANIVGRADRIWMSWNSPETAVRFSRIGTAIQWVWKRISTD